jgi:geranylgeranyl transferase type-1 subunit beta
MTSTQKSLKLNAHTSYFHRVLSGLPSQAEPHDSNRITIAYFCLSGLDLLGRLGPASSRSEEGVGKAGAGNAVGAGAEAGGKRVKEEERKGWIEWVWALQDCQYVSSLVHVCEFYREAY